jgi:hypothetical protein
MPTFTSKDDRSLFGMDPLLQFFTTLLGDLLLDLLAVSVERCELLGQFAAPFAVVSQQQLQRIFRIAYATGSIDVWPEFEADIDGAHVAAVDPAHLHQSIESRSPGRRQRPQALLDDDPILSEKRHDIGDGAQRCEGEQFHQQITGPAVDLLSPCFLSGQRPAQFVRDPRSTQPARE